MSELRVYQYPEWQETPYKYVLLKRCFSNTNETPFRAQPVEHDNRLDESLSRSRRIIQELILCNRFDLFCTFTFDKSKVRNREDYKAIKKQLVKFFNNYRNRYDADFRYLIVPELHKDGAVHFHGVITLPKNAPTDKGICCHLKVPYRSESGRLYMVPNTKGYMDWPAYSDKFGFFSCSWIRDYTRCAIYVSKYMTKDLASWFNKGDKIVMSSQGLNRPELVYMGENEGIPDFDTSNGDKEFDFCCVAMREECDKEWDKLYYLRNSSALWQEIVASRKYDYPVFESADKFEDMEGIASLWPAPFPVYGPVDEFEQVSMLFLQQ